MAVACSRIYFAMESLAQVHFLYQLSLRFFLDIFYELLNNNTNLEGVKEPSERLSILIRDLFQLVFKRVSRTLLHDDYITFGLQIAYINLKGIVFVVVVAVVVVVLSKALQAQAMRLMKQVMNSFYVEGTISHRPTSV